MKSPIPQPKSVPFTLLSLVLLGWLFSADPAAGQGTAFTYQGRAVFQGYSANGYYDLTFSLFDAASAGTQIGSTITNLDVAVSNGLFAVSLDFGANFPGADRYLELGVRTNSPDDSGVFTTLSPRQQLTAAPYAVTAAGFTGSVQDSQLSANVALLGGSPTFTSPVSATVSGVDYFMVPRGAIVLWSGSVANIPSDWALCDGTQGTPNLTDKFVVGAGNTYAVADTGGAASHTHNVAMGGSATDSAGAHTHALSGSTDAVADHTHTGPSHTHTSAAHTHTVASHNHTGGDLAFSRQYASSSYTGGGSGGYYISVQSGTSTVCLPNSSQWQGHTGGTALTTDSTTPGATGSAGTGATGAAGGHAHTLTTASAASAGAHTHTISFTVSSASADSRPPYYALCYIMKL